MGDAPQNRCFLKVTRILFYTYKENHEMAEMS